MKSIILAFLLVLWNFDYLNSISVNRVLPKLIGGGGEVLLVIRGTGFSTNSFSLIPDDPNVGNFVFLVNKKSRIVYNCKSHPNGMTSNQIQCFTPPLPLGSYFIRIKVDGQDIHDHNVYCGNTPEAWSCSFQVTIHDTPTITSLNPPTGLPGNLITIKGRIVTRFTNSTMFLKDSTNGITARFTRNFVGNNICYFNDINNKIIHIQLNGANEESLNGEFKCRFEGNYVGAHRAHFIIEQNFGKSIIDRNAMKICYNDIACLYESYAYINEISPVIVSSGMKMSIKGDYLSDETDALLIVEIANIPATILEKSDKELIVLVPDNSLIIILPDYPGNRGMTLELWRNKELAYAELDTITTLSKNDDGVILYESIILSNAQYILSENINIVGKMSGFFVPNIDSNYNFFLKTNGIAKFSISTDHTFDNNVLLIEIDTVTNGADNVFANNEVTLIAGTKYFFQVLFYHNVVDKFLNLGFFQYDSKVLSTVTSDAINEKQNIKIYTERILQIVEINFSAQTAEMSSITEYQSYQVLLIFIDPVATFRFCLNENFCTGILSSISTNELVESALNQIGGNNLFKVTIIVETNGNILYEISRESTSGLVFEQLSILEIVQGTITNTITSSPIPNDPLNEIYSTPFNFRLKFENEDTYYLTNEISFNATPDEIRTELFQSLSPNCPDRITTLDTTTYNGNYRNNYVPLCGKSFKSWVYGVRDGNAMPLSLTNNRYMCLGLRGYFSNYIRIRYYLNDIYTNYGINLPEIMENITIKEWTYTCFDIKSILNVPDALIYSNVYFYRHIRSDIKFIDEVSFVAERIHFDVKNERHVPAFMIEDATITMESSLLTLTLSYYDCVSSPTVSIITSLNVEPTISETSTASEGMTGNFDISYDGITSTIPVDANSIGVKNILNFGDNVSMDQLNVAMTGNCHEKTWTVTWIKNPGRKSLITVSSTSNTNGDVTIEKVNEGRSIFENIPASFSRSNHLTPQVSVTVNNIPVLNDVSSEIDIQYDESIRPEISNVSPDTGSSEDVLTIIGLNFDNVDITNNQVILGDDTLCEIQTVTPTEITCILGIGEKGLKNVSVNVEGKGISVANAIDFNYTYKFNEVSPLFGSTGGGTLLTISGSGFNNDPEVDVSITVGTSICKIVEIKIDQVVCYTSIGSIESAEIIYTENGVDSATSLVYSYSTTDTPQITSIDKATINIDEEDRILTFTGSLFINVDHVYIGGIKSRIIYYTENELAVMIPFLTDGNHEILIHTLKGYALETDNYPVISVDFKINQINYERISAIGGLEIQLIGSGFSLQNDKNRVKIGTVDCNVIESTDTTIKCINGNQSKKKDVDLMSGELYNSPININVGDRLQFIANSWDGSKHRLSFLIDDTEKKIHVIENNQLFADSIQFYDDNFVFSDTDEFIVISDLQNELNEFLVYTRLIIIPVESTLDKVTLKINEIEPAYLNSHLLLENPTLSSCPSNENTGCVESSEFNSLVSDYNSMSDQFAIIHTKCLVAKVYTMNINTGTTNDFIEFTGENYPNLDCLNIFLVSFDQTSQCSCIIDAGSFTNTFAKCKIDTSCDLVPFVEHSISVIVENKGNALVEGNIEKLMKFTLIPNIDSCLPASPDNSGSINGKTLFQFVGSGLGSTDPSVGNFEYIHISINNVHCENVNLHSSVKITCLTPSNFIEEADTLVSLLLYGYPIDLPTGCQFSYLTAKTPVISTISSDFIASNSNIVITGLYFGTISNDIILSFGGVSCDTVSSVTETEITCQQTSLPYGVVNVELSITNFGQATIDATASSINVVPSIIPAVVGLTTGSLQGGKEMMFYGNGLDIESGRIFLRDENLNDIPCVISEGGTHDMFFCITTKVVQEYIDLNIFFIYTVNGIDVETDTFATFSYLNSATPSLTGVSPATGNGGTEVTISGQLFDNLSIVSINGQDCTVLIFSDVGPTLICQVPTNLPGTYEFKVFNPIYGLALGVESFQFTYEMRVDSFLPTSGSIMGGTILTINGVGLSENVKFFIGNEQCSDVFCLSDFTRCECSTPKLLDAENTKIFGYQYDSGNRIELITSFTYSDIMTPTVASVSPIVGGTAGGTTLTIQGTKFDTLNENIKVFINGVECTVLNVIDTQITCQTEPVTTINMDYTEPILIQVSVLSKGIAINNNAYFEYIDLWSSRHTWGGANLPIENDFVVITSKQHIRLDISTPKLSMLLIKGGKLSFAEQDIELKVDNILITEGGIFQVGTEEIPFEHRATITMTGKIRAPELPIYGAKTLAIREGGLELHGRKTPETWSLLAETINIGENTIILTTQVNWLVGDEIVIASTGDHNSQNENEKFSITNIAADEKTITLNKNAEYRHLGITETYANGASIELRAEVGLLTHNIVFQGSYNDQWADVIEKCPERFDTGQFAVQTCFQGRFGAEVGSDEFGGQIMAHGHEYDSNSAKIHIEYVELFNVGQAFRLGRYPVHFHINGNMEGSYVKGCSIHKTYNRAINIHNSHHILIERNVIYDVMGGAVFLEDSIERENILQYNLLVHVKSSSSLLTDDISPAGLWVTHPYNIVRHNHIAGGTHFGIWYRMREHPEGPSYDSSICPRFAPLLECFNNTAHSVGWYGLWIFEHYDPRSSAETYGSCSNSGETVPAIFDTMIVWNSLRGAEWVRCSSIQFINFIVGNNFEAGLEHVHIMHHTPQYSTSGAMVKDSTIISHFNYPDRPPCSRYGTTLPFGNGLLYDNVGYINFDGESNGRICSAFGLVIVVCECTSYCGGYSYRFKNIQWINSEKRSYLKWEHMLELVDLDGSLTGGLPDSRIIASTNLVPASICSIDTTGRWNVNFSAMVCRPGVDLFRFSFNEALPESLLYKDIIVTNSHGLSIVPFIIKRDVHREGWMFMGSVNDVHSIVFHDAEQLVNISYIGKIWELPGQSYVLIRHMLKQPWYDIINISTQPIADHNYTMTTALDVGIVPWSTNNIFGDYYHDSVNMHLTYLGVCSPYNIPICNLPISFKSLKCFYYGCELPEGGDEVEAVTVTPDDYLNWSHPSSWSNVETNNKGYSSILKNGIPDNAAIVIIPRGVWIIVDNIPYYPIFEQIIVRGTLEIKDNTQTNILQKLEIHAINIVIYGGHIFAGTHEKSFTRKLDIILYGNHDTPEFPSEFGPKIGSKSISVFGTLQLFGSLRGNSQAELVNSVHTGESLILLNKKVNWVAGDEIIITTSSFYSHETEIFTIVSIELQSLITLDHTLKYDHIIIKESVSQGAKYTNYEIKVYVALVSRNIKIIGNDGGVMMSQSFGGRILVGRTTEVKIVDNIPKTKSYKGKIRLESVEFKYCGQEGFVSPSDPRFPVSFVDIRNDVNEVKDNFVKNCAFNHCFSPAIGVFASDNIDIIRNIVYHTVGSAIITNGQNTVITHNLVVTNKFTGTYNRRYESSNLNYDGSVHTVDSINTICRNNIVIGSERAAFNVGGELCVSSESNAWSNNLIGASFMGVLIEPDNCQALKIENQPKCTKIRSFIIWRTWSYGIYVQSKCSTIFSENTLIDTKIGTFALVIGQSPTLHSLSKKFVIIERSLYVGQSKNFDCAKYNIENTEEGFVKIASNALPPRIGGKQAYHAILWPNSNEMDNMFPELLFHLTKGLFLLSFDIDVRHTDFVNYNIGCQNSINYMFVYNPLNKDFDHMIKTSGIKTFNVAENNIVKFGRPKVSNIITFGGCIDMDCDAKKKLMIKDMDATLFKSFINRQNVKHTIISDSAFEWNGDRRRGYGDYRIPKTMATDLDGNRIPYNEIYKKIGVQNYNCVWNDVWTAYKCDKGDYYHLLLESLDPDTLIRRIGPVAILSGDLFLDILNGPSDHGICEGYACRHRLSAYWPIVVANSNYTIHLTATPPQNLRLWLPSTKKIYISVALYYATSQRIDVTANGAYVVPSNRELVAPGQFRFKNVLHPFASIFKSISGDHIYDIVSKTLYITLESNIDYKIKIIPVVRFSFQLPDMTIDEFFGIDIIDNLRIFLGLDPSQVRIVNIISETAPLNRKRQVPWTGLSVQLEFGDNPGMQSPVIQYNKLKQISDQLGEAIQSNTISSVMNATVINMIIYDAIPYSSDPIYAEYITVSDANVGEFQPKAIISIPDSVVITQQPINIHENVYFEKPIVVCVYDVNKIPIMTLYSSSGLWQIKLTLLDENDTVIHSIKNNIGDVIAGCAKFTDLIIYSVNATKQYRLDVKVLHNFFESLVLQTIPFQIQKQLIEAPLLSMKVEPNTLFAFKAKIVDFLTRSTVDLEDQTWEITIAPDLNCADNMKLEMYDGENQQISNITINLDPNKKYSSMQTTELIKIMNNESIFTFFSKIKGSLEFTAVESFATVYVGSILENVEIDSIKKNMIFKLDEKFTALKNISFEGVSLCLKTKIEKINRNIIISNFSLTDGSILVNTNINGTSIELDSFINDVKSMLGMNELFRYSHFSAHFNSYLAVDGIVVQEEMDDYTTTILIAVLVPFFLIIISILIIVIIYFVNRNKNKLRPQRSSVKVESILTENVAKV